MSNNDVYKDVYKKFGNRLRELRLNKKLSQQALAHEIGISQSAIHKYENGLRKIPMSILETFANYYEMSISELIEQEIDNTKDVDGEPNYIREIKAYNLTESEIDDIMKYVRYVVTQRNHRT